MNKLGERIRELRGARGLSQAKFAQWLGVTGAAVSAYENGVRLPSYGVLLKIARLFHVSTDDLLGAGKRHTLDVTGLTPKQRSAVQEMVAAYELSNRCAQLLGQDDQYSRVLAELGLDRE